VSVLDERLEVMRARREDMQNRLDQGLVTVNELLEVEMGIAELDANRASAADGRDTAADRLRSLTGVPFDTELDLSYELTDGPDVETGAVERRAVVRSAERAVAAAEGGLAVQRAGFLPQLFLTGEYTYARPNPEAFPPRNEFSDSWRIGIAGRIPLGGMPQTYFAAESARAELSRARAELSDVRSRARLEVRAASRRHATSAEQVAAARAVLRRAEENERSVRTRFENGRALRTDVLDAQALRVEAEMRLIEARIARQIALHELRFALGREVL
jgi:outer membrane protein TolC